MKAWVASLSRDELMAVAQQVTSGALGGGLVQLGEFGARNREIDLPPPPDEASLLTLTIELRGSKPRIWRRLSLPGDLTLDVVHTLFQAVMGWTDSHLHRFLPGTPTATASRSSSRSSTRRRATRAPARTVSAWIRFCVPLAID